VIKQGDPIPDTVKNNTNVVLLHKENHDWVREVGITLWVKGANVFVHDGMLGEGSWDYLVQTHCPDGRELVLIDLWHYLIATRLDDDEPITALIAYMRGRSALKKTYAKTVTLFLISYAKAVRARKLKDVRIRFHRLLYGMVQPGTKWED